MESNPYRFIAIKEAVEIHCSFLCVKDKAGNYIIKDNDILIGCCKMHVFLMKLKDQEHIEILNYYFDNIDLLYKLYQFETTK